MEKEIYIHIGAPRTGTSYLRNNIFPYIENVYFENKLEYREGKSFPLVKFFSKIAHYGDGDELSASVLNEIMPNVKKRKILISEEHMIWSVYHMMGNVGSRALLLKKCCPNAKIIMTIRRQPEYFISLFKYFTTLDSSNLQRQMNQINNMLNLDVEIEQIMIYFKLGLPSGIEITQRYRMFAVSDKYFDRNYRHFIATNFSWFRLYEIYEYLFGQDNVLVLPQEMILKDIKSTLELISQFIGEKIYPKSSSISKRDNTTNQIRNPFRNETQKNDFVNYIMKLNAFSNRELNNKIEYIDLKKYKYTDFSETGSIKIIIGQKSSTAIKINQKKCFYFNYIINSYKRRGILKTFILLTLKIRNFLIRRTKLFLKFLYHRFALLSDKMRGLDFEQIESIEKLGLKSENSEQYESAKIFELRKIFREVCLQKKIIVMDFGSGKGHVLSFFAKQKNVNKVYGIEISNKLVEIARHNIQKLGLSGISILNIDARDTPNKIIDETNLFYLYNPFPEHVISSVLKKIELSLRRNVREVCLIYFNPIYESVIEDSPMFKKYKKYNNLISFAKTVVFKSCVI